MAADIGGVPDVVDVVVVGGGIAGVSAGHFLAEQGAQVLVLEREPVLAHHTTGRSAALYLENYGADPVRRLTLASRPFLEQPPEGLVDSLLLSARASMDVAGAGRADVARRHATHGAELVPSVRLLSPQEAAELCPVLRPEVLDAAVLEPHAKDIDVMALHQGFVRGLRRNRGVVRTSAPALRVERVSHGWVVGTPQGDVRARILLNAAGAWGDELARTAGMRPLGLQPLHRTAFTVPLPPGVDARSWPLVQDLDEGWYFKPEGDGLLCSLADETPEAPCDAKPREEDVALAMERINDVTTLALRRVHTAWAGLRVFAPGRLPVIGPDPDEAAFVWLVGLGGFGIMTAPAVGMLAAATALGIPLPPALADLAVEPAEYSAARLR